MNFVGNLKILILTDRANAYDAIMSGHPHTTECFLSIGLAYIRDLATLCVISFIDKNYNLIDSAPKSTGGKHSPMKLPTHYNDSKFGFTGDLEFKN